jgi:hypothetical protein
MSEVLWTGLRPSGQAGGSQAAKRYSLLKRKASAKYLMRQSGFSTIQLSAPAVQSGCYVAESPDFKLLMVMCAKGTDVFP